MPSTFYLCRASGPLTKGYSCQTVAIFTLVGHGQGRNAVTALFYSIGLHVLQHGIKSQLSKATVVASLSKASGKNKKLLEEILLLFVNAEEIEIIGNVMLNSVLEKLADLLMPVIVTVNNSVYSHVDIFEFYD
ncbi:hypothetical protein RMATCC62417_11886 [Rhizopus microsporus]|nr:hypothetical protein RMATCC62417_11886 [Rhizopus microsporus]